MKTLFCYLIVLFSVVSASYAQSTPSPTPQTAAAESRSNYRRIEPAQNSSPRIITSANILRLTEYLYRNPTKEELKNIAPETTDKEKYANFLKQSNTGLIRLMPDFGCNENTKIVVASDECVKYSMPGNGSAFSFRTKNYRIGRLADLLFKNNAFHAVGILSQGMLVNIGDVELEKLSLDNAGMLFINNFQPATDFKKAKLQNDELVKGVKSGEYFYRKAIAATENKTYILRSIAYTGKVFRSERGLIYNEFEFDKRIDVTVAFQVVNKHPDGSITILWKGLAKKDSPKLSGKNKK